jgi:hypothetical protein
VAVAFSFSSDDHTIRGVRAQGKRREETRKWNIGKRPFAMLCSFGGTELVREEKKEGRGLPAPPHDKHKYTTVLLATAQRDFGLLHLFDGDSIFDDDQLL